MKLSFAICVCNEANELNSLLHFLKTVKDPEDEINILVDSKNVTPEVELVLKKYANDIVRCQRVFDGNFSEHRNFHTSHCSGDYIFIIDADEIPQELLVRSIKKIINDTGGDLFYVPRINIIPGYTDQWLDTMKFSVNECGWINWPDWQGRIVKNIPTIKWGNKLHERMIGSKKTIQLSLNPSLALWHVKTVQKQDYQDAMYKLIN